MATRNKKSVGASAPTSTFARDLTLLDPNDIKHEFEDLLTKARTMLVLQSKFVFFTSLIMSLPVRYSSEVHTAAVDGAFLYLNPAGCLARGHKPETLMALLAHEVLHPALKHLSRRMTLPRTEWGQANLAMDHTINLMLHEAGFNTSLFMTQPQSRFSGLSWEEVFAILAREQTEATIENSDMLIPVSTGDSTEEDETKAVNNYDAQEQTWLKRIIQATEVAKQKQGVVPAFADLAIKAFESSSTPWYMLLRQFITPDQFDVPQWNPGDSRYRAHGVRVPAATRNRFKSVVVAVDTSGSILSDELLETFASELSAILTTVKAAKTIVVYCDAAVQFVDEFYPSDPLVLTPKGGGGTKFDPVFEWVEENNVDCGALIYLTDGYASAPSVIGDYPVIWAVSSTHYDHLKDFGHIIELPHD